MTLPVRDTLHEAFFAMISFPDLLMECQLSKEFLDHQFVFLHDLEAPAKATTQKGTFPFSAPHARAAGILLPGCRLGISGLISCGFCFVVPLRKTRCPWHFGEVRGVGNQDRNGMTWTELDSQASINTIVLQPSQDVRSVTTP